MLPKVEDGDAVRRRIREDDPDLVRLKIKNGCLIDLRDDCCHRQRQDDDWGGLGEDIGRNTHLRELIYSGNHGPAGEKKNLMSFFRGVAGNRSIRGLKLTSCELFGRRRFRIFALPKSNKREREIFHVLVPFFRGNSNFRCLQIRQCGMGPECLGSLTAALREFDSLEEFEVSGCGLEDDGARELIAALHQHHSGLRKIEMWYHAIGRNSCASLTALLQSPTCELAVLIIEEDGIDDKGAIVLARGLKENSSLKELNLSKNYPISPTGWQAIFDAMQGSSCSLEKICLQGNNIDDAARFSLSRALPNHTHLKTLDLCRKDPIWNHDIHVIGWRALFGYIQSTRCTLENLDLGGNGLNDDKVTALAAALANNSSLRTLGLSRNRAITNAGWQAFSAVLQHPTTTLEELDVVKNSSNDEIILSFANSLGNNIVLKKLLLYCESDYGPGPAIAPGGWAAFSRVLCNTSSIMATYHSNHTIQYLCKHHIEDSLPEDILALLRLNRYSSRSRSARLKIITTHFFDGFVGRPFVDMEAKVLPRAIAWIGRDGRSEVDGRFYEFLRGTPSLFDMQGHRTNKNQLER